MLVSFKAGTEPLRRETKIAPMSLVVGSAKRIVVSESPLRDSNRVILHANASVIIQHRNAAQIAWAGVFRLLAECHVVLAQRVCRGIVVEFGGIVPETELTC